MLGFIPIYIAVLTPTLVHAYTLEEKNKNHHARAIEAERRRIYGFFIQRVLNRHAVLNLCLLSSMLAGAVNGDRTPARCGWVSRVRDAWADSRRAWDG